MSSSSGVLFGNRFRRIALIACNSLARPTRSSRLRACPRQRLAPATSAIATPSKRAVLVSLSAVAATLLASRHAYRGLALAGDAPQRTLTAAASGVQISAAMHNQDWLVDHLKRDGVVKHHEVEQVLRQVDRKNYVDRGIPHAYIYQDSPLPIGYHETISAPHMHGVCLELLREHLREGARVLDVGSGSGYLSAAMGLMVGGTGKVIGIEKHPELAQESVANVRRDHPELLDSGVLQLRAGNVLGNVLEHEEAFDAIHVGAAASSLPDVLVQKLKPGGRMVIPVGPQWEYQVMQCIDKDEAGKVHKHNLMHVRYVPLTTPGDSDWEQ